MEQGHTRDPLKRIAGVLFPDGVELFSFSSHRLGGPKSHPP
jgi:hypothetical protein